MPAHALPAKVPVHLQIRQAKAALLFLLTVAMPFCSGCPPLLPGLKYITALHAMPAHATVHIQVRQAKAVSVSWRFAVPFCHLCCLKYSLESLAGGCNASKGACAPADMSGEEGLMPTFTVPSC